jgi:hypothetical protein
VTTHLPEYDKIIETPKKSEQALSPIRVDFSRFGDTTPIGRANSESDDVNSETSDSQTSDISIQKQEQHVIQHNVDPAVVRAYSTLHIKLIIADARLSRTTCRR